MKPLKACVLECRKGCRRDAHVALGIALASALLLPIGGNALAQATVDAAKDIGMNVAHPNGDALTTRNDSGGLRTVTPTGAIDTANPFFQNLGSNGRSCSTCHQIQDGWSNTPKTARQRFDATGGRDPLFRDRRFQLAAR